MLLGPTIPRNARNGRNTPMGRDHAPRSVGTRSEPGRADRPVNRPGQSAKTDVDGMCIGDRLPFLLTPGETAALLRTSRKAVYALAERHQLPGVTRIGRRILIRSDELVDWLRQKCTPSPKG